MHKAAVNNKHASEEWSVASARRKFKSWACMQIMSISGMRCWVSGMIRLPDSEIVLATCEAQLADLQPILAAQKL